MPKHKREKPLHLEAFAAATAWKRWFFNTTNFSDVDALLLDATRGGSARPYVEDFLGLRGRSNNRWTMADVDAAYASGAVLPLWIQQLSTGLWLRYTVERRQNRRQILDLLEPVECRNMSRAQRRMLLGLGIVYRRRPAAGVRAAQQMKRLADLIGRRPVLLWVDNYNVHRFASNPSFARDKSINGTVYAALPLQLDLPHGTWLPTMREMYEAIPTVARWLQLLGGSLGDATRSILTIDLQWEDVRVPVDLRRRCVSSLP